MPAINSEITVERNDLGRTVNFREPDEAGVANDIGRLRYWGISARRSACSFSTPIATRDDTSLQQRKQSIGVAALAL